MNGGTRNLSHTWSNKSELVDIGRSTLDILLQLTVRLAAIHP